MSSISTAFPKCNPNAPVESIDRTSLTVFPQLCSITMKLSSCTSSTIFFIYVEENSSHWSGAKSPAAGSAMIIPAAPASLKAFAYDTRNVVALLSTICTVSGSSKSDTIISVISKSLQASEKGPICPPNEGLSAIFRALKAAALI